MLNVEDWAEIRRLHRAEGMAIRAIARRLGISKNTVKKALASHEPPRYERAAKGSIVDAVEPQIRALLSEFPEMPSTVIMERIGWERGKTVFFERVQQLRPLFTPADPASRTEYQPGELAQCDLWFPPADVPLGFGQTGRPPVLVMVAGYSRMITAVMLPSRQSPDLLAGHWTLISGWGRVPKALVWDNESAVGQWRGGKPQLTEPMNAFRGTLGIKVIQCRPRDPESKGLVERANGYLETSFLPGRSFTSPGDFNSQLAGWLERANQRQHRRLGCRPLDRWGADRSAMLALPPIAPVTGWRLSTRLPRDHYVRLDSNDYSVHPSAVGRRVQIAADLAEVVVTCDNTQVAQHARCWADHQSITDPAHAAAAAQMRQARRLVAIPKADTSVEHRHLADYDRLFGLTGSDEEIA
ncbi:IS21 family transposase [Amycolatopsis acidicola]|uniref:IS21 family transposase n=1 Tax=Amycolatopsis acidicola TaxID=2596893 RepID=A0A5N0VF22_9PSEU|nr:IS21 family transposase [Amycolatopsis acidicola]KAA9164044.1 IS21 family transposase [Amycolatopsis acidicola]